MKTNVILLILITIGINYGCASSEETTGLDRSEQATSSMETVYDDVKSTLDQIEEVESSLSDLTRSGQSDVSAAFNNYAEDVSALEEQGNRLLENKNSMNENVDAYFSGWQSEGETYDNDRIQELSSERRDELQRTYNRVEQRGENLEERLTNFISDTKEIRDYLSNDLTSSGISAIDTLADDILDDSDDIKRSLNRIQDALEDALSEMARRGT